MGIQDNLPRSNVGALSNKPEEQHKQTEATRDERRIIHVCRVHGQGEGEAEDDDEDDDVGACDSIDHEPHSPFHPEPARHHVLSSAQQMREDRCDV